MGDKALLVMRQAGEVLGLPQIEQLIHQYDPDSLPLSVTQLQARHKTPRRFSRTIKSTHLMHSFIAPVFGPVSEYFLMVDVMPEDYIEELVMFLWGLVCEAKTNKLYIGLRLHYCNREVIMAVSRLSSLVYLDVDGCQNGALDVPAVFDIPQLRYLRLLNIKGPVDLTGIGRLCNLKHLDLGKLTLVPEDWTHLAQLAALRTLKLSSLGGSAHDSTLALMAGLLHLKIRVYGPSNFVGGLPNLQTLKINCSMLLFGLPQPALGLPKPEIGLSALYCITNLTKLTLQHSCGVLDMSPVSSLSLLEELSLDNMCLVDLDFVKPLINLKNMRVVWCPGLVDISGIRRLVSLLNLELRASAELVGLSALLGLVSVEKLIINDNFFVDVPGIVRSMTGLRHLEVCGGSTASLEFVHYKTRVLKFDKNSHLRCISALRGLPSIVDLTIDDCTFIHDMSPVSSLVGLQRLRLQKTLMNDVDFLRPLTKLVVLEIAMCNRIRDMSPVSKLLGLKHLTLYQASVKDVGFLRPLAKLEVLVLDGFSDLTDLTDLQCLVKLTELSLEGCGRITSLDSLRSLSALLYLNIDHCEGLIDISALRSLTNILRIRMDEHTGTWASDIFDGWPKIDMLPFLDSIPPGCYQRPIAIC